MKYDFDKIQDGCLVGGGLHSLNALPFSVNDSNDYSNNQKFRL